LLPAVVHRLLHPATRIVLWSHDLYPDAAEALGALRPGGATARALRRVKRWLVRYVDHVVAVDGAMLDRLVSGYVASGAPAAGTVIPTWEPVALFPGGPRPEPWDGYRDPELAGRFVVLHLGNLGMGHRTDTIADAAAVLAGEGAVFLVVGGGVRVGALASAAAARGATNVVVRGYVPRERTPAVLAGAGCTLISLDDRSRGIMSPSKMNPSLAMGIPIVYVGPTGTNVDATIERYGCGFSLRQGDVRGVADAIRRIRDDASLAGELSRNARRAFEERHSDERALLRFDEVLTLVAPPTG
jgi:glycosyltransferase involved in cell wall biosynthesis